mmetsp:Transcript_34202/g.87467  ORF Transcript_34202/g.87467 Transcript_34202/m.87467 type:complete len:242 (+) Transcript_34202:1150-1875(+)
MQRVFLRLDLSQQRLANEAGAHKAHCKRDIAQVETGMDGLQGARDISLLDEDGDVVLTAALGNAPDVDVVGRQGREERGRGTAARRHALAHSRQQGTVVDDLDGGDGADSQGVLEPLTQDIAGLGAVRALYGKADRVLRGGLADHDHVDARVPHGAEDGGGDTGHAHHAGALHVDETTVVNGGEAGHALGGAARGVDYRPWCIQVEKVAQRDGDAVLHGRLRGPGMQHVGAEVGQLPCLVV